MKQNNQVNIEWPSFIEIFIPRQNILWIPPICYAKKIVAIKKPNEIPTYYIVSHTGNVILGIFHPKENKKIAEEISWYNKWDFKTHSKFK